MTTPKERMSDERLAELREMYFNNQGVKNLFAECISEIDALRAELTAARTVEDGEVAKVVERQSQLAAYFDGRQSTMVIRAKEAINLLTRLSAAKAEAELLLQVERGAARAALAQAREAALEEAAKVVEGQSVATNYLPDRYDVNSLASWLSDRDFRTATAIRALKTTPTQESETP